jgi:endonuclease-3
MPRASSPRPSRSPAAAVIDRLARVFPGATTELNFHNAFELLVATILSAQSTDARVNEVTPALFARYPDARALAAADAGDVEALVKATGFFRTKARAIIGAAAQIVARHDGDVPASLDDLVALPGVGRKTANVVLGHALGIPGLPVDRHVLRVATRLGLARAGTPEAVEQRLCAALPPSRWTLASDALILHGRRVCRPRPLCPACVLTDLCRFYASGAVAASGQRARRPAHTRAAHPPEPAPPAGRTRTTRRHRSPDGSDGTPRAPARPKRRR